MKHLKNINNFIIKESINRYDFGFIDPSVFNNENFYINDTYPFEETDLEYIRTNLSNPEYIHHSVKPHLLIIGLQYGNPFYFHVEYLGDYIFVLYKETSNETQSVEIIDGIEEVVTRINDYYSDLHKIRIESGIIKESFDKYDFKYVSIDDMEIDNLNSVYDEIIDGGIDMLPGIYEQCMNMEHGKYTFGSINTKYKAFSLTPNKRESIADLFYVCEYLTDYCYMISEQDGTTQDIFSIETFSDDESFLSAITDIINGEYHE